MQKVRIVSRKPDQTEYGFHHGLLDRIYERRKFRGIRPVIFFRTDRAENALETTRAT